MLCAISGEVAEVPVASRKSGNVFEKRLIETYIQDNARDPITGEELALDDLIELHTERAVKPRPPTFTSIPALLSVFQNEWDALALETFQLRQQLTLTRQELSNALYENDAAKRVVARLQKERNEAREALSKTAINGALGAASGGDAMQVDGRSLSSDLAQKVTDTQERLSKTRRKRPVPEGWASPSTVSDFAPSQSSKNIIPGSHSLALQSRGDPVLIGGREATAAVYSMTKKKTLHTLDAGAPITKVLWVESHAALANAKGSLKIFDNGSEQVSSSVHSGSVVDLALHPSQDILASVGSDGTFVLYDVANNYSVALKASTDSALTSVQFHPDGHLLAAGGADGQIKLFDTKSGAHAANFEESGPIGALTFSENGFWLAAVCRGSTTVSIWDLRKSAKVKELEMGGTLTALKWDYSGQYLAGAGPGGLTVQGYDKGSKEWSVLLQTAVPSTAIEWGAEAQSLITINEDGGITVLSAPE